MPQPTPSVPSVPQTTSHISENTPPRPSLATLWTDGLGKASIRSVQALAVAALVVVVLWAITRVPLVLIPVTLALILASAISPLVHLLARRHWPQALAVAASFLAILVVFGGVVTGVVYLIRAQARELAVRFTNGIQQLHDLLNNGPVKVSDAQLNSARDSIQRFFTNGSIGAEALSGAKAVGEIFAGVVLMVVILFFFLKDGPKIRGFFVGFMPSAHQATAHRALERSARVLGGYVRGTALVALTDAVIVGVALLILHVPLAVPLAVFVFIGGFIPIVGATVAGFLAVVVALVSNGPVAAVVVLAVIIAVNQLEHHVLQPAFMGRVLSIHGLAIVLSLAAGTMLAGIVGALLAVPVTAVGWTIIKTWRGRDEIQAA
ncbi:AI-2E family transporter [Sinomonas terrae]|uniref:AI-2E family transporter n=1 Tax=Sinomonas terrae TaxID=2908838 RepID=A0ABS9TWL2_9MICC|nr:AI-2E family transporter [Sinomonas terrae]MCH6468761.1 AI-2E family transporter [Sinomonas terrae]